MKKHDWIFLTTVSIFSYLFWKQMPGLNFLIFTSILLIGQILLDKEILKSRNWIFAAIGALCSAYCVFEFGSLLGILATFFSLLLASYFALIKNGSVLVGILSSITSVLVSVGYMVSDSIARRMKNKDVESKNRSGKKVVIVIVALAISLIFFFMYRESSLMFYNLTQQINFDWISIAWIGFTFLGAVVVYGFYYHNSFVGITDSDNNRQLDLVPDAKETWLDKLLSMDSEQFSGIVLFSLLNILLLVVNILDANFIFNGGGKLPQGVGCMQYVHQGVGMLITSIISAMLIILYYFRGRINFSKSGKYLRVLAFIWIFQNAFMLYSTFWRSEVYTFAFGLTYKRIGVYVYLLLTLIGLLVTAWKVGGKKTNAFLIRTNSWLFYSVWVISCFFNWDKIIFDNNVSISKKPDLYYLNSLSMDILPALNNYARTHHLEIGSSSYYQRLPIRIFVFLNREKCLQEENRWPSFTLLSRHNYQALLSQKNFGNDTIINIPDAELKHIYYFKEFENIKSLDLSHNDLSDLGELGQYKNLQTLDLSANYQLDSLNGIEQLKNLEYLTINGLNLKDYSPLLKLKKLTTICTNNIPDQWKNKLEKANPNLHINISGNDYWP